ncbi:hypothetical protein E2C01_056084 [Portunus trituberculatus]|uniref:Uncharacterized protein n=1 Tax=Portunus trituberculatus TaxID=210409 RepID=A0A5B7GX88_PORTR|nr:hypothetical protein [Portunus trituberculatus]
MAKLLEGGRDRNVRQRLLRRHTEEEPPRPQRREQVKRSTSAGERGRQHGPCKGEDITSCHPSSLAAPLSSLEVRARRLAWSARESVTPTLKQPTEGRPADCVTCPSRQRPKSSGQLVYSLSPAAQTPQVTRKTSEASNDLDEYTCIGTGVEITKREPAAKGGQARQEHHRQRSDSWPEVTWPQIVRRASLTSLGHASYGSKLEVEPYDGLIIQKAPVLTGPSKGETPPPCGHEADEESDAEDNEQTSPARLRGYWAKGGSTFLPFRKLFTKPRQMNEELEVGNSFQQLSQSEREVISRTRRELKQRLSSANRRRGNKDDKMQLSIIVSPPADGDHSSGGEEFRSPFIRTSIPVLPDDQCEGSSQPQEDAYVPPQLLKKGARQSVFRKSSGGRRVMGRGFFRRPRRQEVTTVMSQVSPVPSDHESQPGHNASQGQGGLLQAILTDAETYANSRENRATVSSKVRRGRR